MKKLVGLLSLLLAVGCLPPAKEKTRALEFNELPSLQIEYSEDKEQPLFISYGIPSWAAWQHARPKVSWAKLEGVHTSDNDDYYDNVWDRGHGLPSLHVSYDRDKQIATFNYANCFLQHQTLNRQAIRKLEGYIWVELASRERWIEIEAIFSEDSEELVTGATIPDGFSYTIRYDGCTEVYYFENISDSDYKDNLISKDCS